MRSRPSVTGETAAIMRMVEVLPAPLGPRKPKASPGCTSKSMPSTATNDPNRLVSDVASMSGAPGAGVTDIRANLPAGCDTGAGSSGGRRRHQQ